MYCRGATILPVVIFCYCRPIFCLAWPLFSAVSTTTAPPYGSFRKCRFGQTTATTAINRRRLQVAAVAAMVSSGDGSSAAGAATISSPAARPIHLLPEVRKGEDNGGGLKRSRQPRSSIKGGPSDMPALTPLELHSTVGEFPVDYTMHKTNRCHSVSDLERERERESFCSSGLYVLWNLIMHALDGALLAGLCLRLYLLHVPVAVLPNSTSSIDVNLLCDLSSPCNKTRTTTTNPTPNKSPTLDFFFNSTI